MLAGLGAGCFSDLTQARRSMAEALGPERIVEPNEEWAKRYEDLYHNIYVQLAPALSPIHDALASFRQRHR
jgi:hypothetical protein